MPDELQNVICLPTIVCGLPVHESPNGFRILRAVINDSSSSYSEILDKIPREWHLPCNYQRGDYKIKITCNNRPFPDTPYVFVGQVVNDPKFGIQFKAIDFYPDEPSDEKMMQEYLNRLPNVGPKRARMMLKVFGVKEIGDVIENRLKELVDAVPGITEERAIILQKKWKEDRTIREVYMWIISHGISATFGKKIIDHFGEHSIDILTKNPYALTEIYGIGFTKADEIAHKIMKEIPKDMRTKYCLIYLLTEKASSGHTCYPIVDLQRAAHELLTQSDGEDYTRYVRDSILNDFVMLRDYESETDFCYLPSLFYDEYDCAKYLTLSNMYQSDLACSDEDINEAELDCSDYNIDSDVKIQFDENQRAAIKSVFENKVTVLTGGGGTGKSTICHAICSIAKKKGWRVTLFAPTGQAAKVLSHKTKQVATTIHRGLGLLPSGKKINTVDESGLDDFKIKSEVLVIDEFSMVGTDILPYVFRAIASPKKTNIVFVGDPQQLPSVSPGNNLHDIIQLGCANVVKLNRIYRQSEKSCIPLIADSIAHGEEPQLPEVSDDFFWTEVGGVTDALNRFLELMEMYPDTESAKKMQIITPMYDKECGVNAINHEMQKKYTMQTGQYVSHNSHAFYLGDRVMQIKNNYEKNVFNGNIGYIIDIGQKIVNPQVSDQPSNFITVEFEGNFGKGGPILTYTDDQISELRVSWCSTVHKFQGSQVSHVIFFMLPAHKHMMTKELVYTAITRAQKRLDVLGIFYMMGYASRRSEVHKRFTNLCGLYKKINGVNTSVSFIIAKSVMREDFIIGSAQQDSHPDQKTSQQTHEQ